MDNKKPIVVGAVIYDPKVTVIWNIIRDFFEEARCPIDVVFYSNYELQVDGLAKGHLEIAWNSPLAWIDTERQLKKQCRAIAMRDTDRDRVSHMVVKRDAGIWSAADLKSKTVAFGAKDSPQATLIPMEWLSRQGLKAGAAYEARRFDLLVGLHGDHVGGEKEAFRCLERGDAAASWMLDLNWDAWNKDGTVDGSRYAVLASTERYDHCNFSVRADFAEDREKRFLKALFSMTYGNPKHKEMMDLEGLKAWEPGRTSGYAALGRAVEDLRFFEGA
jgi:ABC-type phosphate/phosphonate transport system substrate-binding protein